MLFFSILTEDSTIVQGFFFNLFIFRFEFTPVGITSVKRLLNIVSNVRPANLFQIYVEILF